MEQKREKNFTRLKYLSPARAKTTMQIMVRVKLDKQRPDLVVIWLWRRRWGLGQMMRFVMTFNMRVCGYLV